MIPGEQAGDRVTRPTPAAPAAESRPIVAGTRSGSSSAPSPSPAAPGRGRGPASPVPGPAQARGRRRDPRPTAATLPISVSRRRGPSASRPSRRGDHADEQGRGRRPLGGAQQVPPRSSLINRDQRRAENAVTITIATRAPGRSRAQRRAHASRGNVSISSPSVSEACARSVRSSSGRWMSASRSCSRGSRPDLLEDLGAARSP